MKPTVLPSFTGAVGKCCPQELGELIEKYDLDGVWIPGDKGSALDTVQNESGSILENFDILLWGQVTQRVISQFANWKITIFHTGLIMFIIYK